MNPLTLISRLTKIFIILLLILLNKSYVFAQQTNQVMAVICDSAGPEITINHPISDSIVNTPEVVITGVAERTSQIDFYINDQYDSSLAFTSDPNFQKTIQLQEGTNTLRLDASFSCNNTNSTTSVVIDYHAVDIPSVPSDTDTSISTGLPPSNRNNDRSDIAPKHDSSSHIDNILNNLGLGNQNDTDYNNSYVRTSFNWGFFLVSVLGFGLVFSSVATLRFVCNLLIPIRYIRTKQQLVMLRLVIFIVSLVFAVFLVL